MDKPKAKIFLSYVHADIAFANKLYKDLKSYGLDIWFDNEDLLPGKLWEVEIEKAIESSVFFLALFSSRSVDHVGYAQKELKLALDKFDLYPQDGVYLIPIRLDDCKIAHTEVKKIHWINLFPESKYEEGIRKILKVVSPGAFKLRSSWTGLSYLEVKEMIINYGFYDADINTGGRGCLHEYKPIKCGEVIIDEATGLMWQQGGSAMGLMEYEAKKYIGELNSNKFAGFDDWRLPTLEEAMSLMEPKEITKDLYIDSVFDKTQRFIWTSDEVKGKRRRWVVYFNRGDCDDDGLYYSRFVRAVRSGQSSG
ncbi:TIR domain-containing protein [candidate division KSB1 bacterium]|nr:TIR domain-containing protein [candidate division KSB1 bacterium]